MPTTRQRTRTSGKVTNPSQLARRRVPANYRDQPKLLDVLEWTEHDDDGNPIDGVTVGDRIIDSIRRNMPVDEACKAAGVNLYTYRQWLADGAEVAKLRAAMESGTVMRSRISNRDSVLLWFYQQVEQAKALAEQRLVFAIDARATGEGLVNAVVTRKMEPDPNMPGEFIEVERTEKRNRVLPDTAAVQWLLSRRYPSRWGSTDTLEVLGGGAQGAVEHHHTHSVPVLEDMLAQVAAKIEGRVTDTTASELPAPPPLGDGDQNQDVPPPHDGG